MTLTVFSVIIMVYVSAVFEVVIKAVVTVMLKGLHEIISVRLIRMEL